MAPDVDTSPSTLSLLMSAIITANSHRTGAKIIGIPNPSMVMPLGLDAEILPAILISNTSIGISATLAPPRQAQFNTAVNTTGSWFFMKLSNCSSTSELSLCDHVICLCPDTLLDHTIGNITGLRLVKLTSVSKNSSTNVFPSLPVCPWIPASVTKNVNRIRPLADIHPCQCVQSHTPFRVTQQLSSFARSLVINASERPQAHRKCIIILLEMPHC